LCVSFSLSKFVALGSTFSDVVKQRRKLALKLGAF